MIEQTSTAPHRIAHRALLLIGLALAANTLVSRADPCILPTNPALWRTKTGAISEVPARDGKPAALAWDLGKAQRLSLQTGMPMDVSSYNCMVVTLETTAATTNRIVFEFGIENPFSKKTVRVKADVFLDVVGTTEFRAHFRELTTSFGGGALPEITFLDIVAAGRNRNPLTAQSVILRNLRFVSNAPREATKGPHLTDTELFGALDLDCPALAGVKAAWQTGDTATARKALGSYMRTRSAPRVYQIPANLPTRGGAPQLGRTQKGTGGRYAVAVDLDWSGWKRVELPLTSFQTLGKPIGWHWISDLSLRWQPSGGSPYDGRALHLDDVELLGADGSRLSLGDFEALGSDWSNMMRTTETVHDGQGAGRWQFPEIYPNVKCLCFPANWTPSDRLTFWLHSPAPGAGTITITASSDYPNTAKADGIIDRESFHFWRDKVVLTPEGRIDWSANPMPWDEKWTIEWLAHFNRHEHFPALYEAYWRTGDDKYAGELARQMNEWIEDCPEPLHRSARYNYHYAWHPLNQGARLLNAWPQALSRCLGSPAFSDDIIVNILKSIYEHQERLQKFLGGQNRRTCELSGIYVMGVLFPEFRKAGEWRRVALDGLTEQLTTEIYPDGLSSEMALGYFSGMLRDFLKVVELARDNGLEEEIPPAYIAQLEKSYNYIMGDSMPNGTAFGVNDSGNPDIRKTVIKGYRLFPERDDFVHAISAGRGGRRPETDSVFFPYCGHGVMRSGWDADARVLHFDVGPYGASHQHADKLNVGLFAYDKLLLAESGWVMYDTSRWRAYSLLTRSHNTVLIDGMDQYWPNSGERSVWPKPWDQPAPAASEARWLSAPALDYCVGWYRGRYREYRDFMPVEEEPKYVDTVHHGRSVLYVKPDVWIIHDRLVAKDDAPHTAQVLYHIYADQAVADSAGVVTSVDGKGPRLTIAPLHPADLSVSIVKGKSDSPIQGWTNSVRGNRKKGDRLLAVPTAIYETDWRKAKEVVTVLYPTPEGAETGMTVESVTVEGDGLGGCFVLPDGARHTYLANRKPGTLLKAGSLTTDAEAVDACTDAGNKLRLSMVNGTTLADVRAKLTVSPAATAAVAGMTPTVLTAGTDRDTRVSLVLPRVANRPKLAVWLLDLNHKREARAVVERNGETLVWTATASRLYEISLDGASTLIARENTIQAAASEKTKHPIKPQPKLAPVKGVRIVVQAEDYTAQGGGGVAISTTKMGMDGTAFSCWDNRGHWLEYTVDVPVDGAYAVTVQVCMEEPAERALLVDGAYPDAVFCSFALAPTGGFSNASDDWENRELPGLLHLRKGKHVLRFINLSKPANLDWISLHAPGESARK